MKRLSSRYRHRHASVCRPKAGGIHMRRRDDTIMVKQLVSKYDHVGR